MSNFAMSAESVTSLKRLKSNRSTGCSRHSPSSPSIAKPSNRSRRPWKYASMVDTSKVLPKRRGRERNTYLPPKCVKSYTQRVLSA